MSVATPELFVVANGVANVPHAPLGDGLDAVNITESFATAAPELLVTLAVNTCVAVPVASSVGDVGDSFTVFAVVVEYWSIGVVAEPPVSDSVAVMLQKPATEELTYATVTVPSEVVVPVVGLSVPQEPANDGDSVKVTVSPETGAPEGFVTVAVTDEAAAPLAASFAGFTTRATVFAGAV